MKKSDEIRRKTWRMLAKNLIILVALAVAAAVGVISWFTNNTTSTADGISVQAQVADGLEYYIMPPSANDQYAAINTRLAENAVWNADPDNSNKTPRRTTWHNSNDGVNGVLTFDYSDQEFKFMQDLFLCDVTGNGSTFKIPKLMQYDETAYVDTAQTFDDAVANENYMSFDIYFRSETEINNHSVSLVSNSSITPLNPVTGTDPIQNFSQSADAEQKKDAAIGAVRMAVLNMGSTQTREVLWIPGPYVYYDGSTDTFYPNVSSSQYSDKGSVYYYDGNSLVAYTDGYNVHEGTCDHAYFESQISRPIIRSAGNSGVYVGSQLGSDKVVVTLNNRSVENGHTYYYGHIRVNLWIEGEDSEARLSFVGGKFRLSMNFEMDNIDH